MNWTRASGHAGGSTPPRITSTDRRSAFLFSQRWHLSVKPVVTRWTIIVVHLDTCFTQRRTQALLDVVRGISHRPIATLFNTHEHGDHTWGNFLLPESTTIVGHERCRTGMLEAGLAAQAIFPGVEWGDIVLRPPTVTFAGRLTLWVDALRLEAT